MNNSPQKVKKKLSNVHHLFFFFSVIFNLHHSTPPITTIITTITMPILSPPRTTIPFRRQPSCLRSPNHKLEKLSLSFKNFFMKISPQCHHLPSPTSSHFIPQTKLHQTYLTNSYNDILLPSTSNKPKITRKPLEHPQKLNSPSRNNYRLPLTNQTRRRNYHPNLKPAKQLQPSSSKTTQTSKLPTILKHN